MDIQKQEEEKKRLTLKQRKWLSIYIACGNATEAAMQVYDVKDRDSANAIGSENLAKLSYTDFLEEAGITDKLLQQKIMEGLDSTKTVSAKIISKGADSQTDDFIDVPDFMARHRYLETALKLKKRLIERQEVSGPDGQSLQFVIQPGGGFIPTARKVDVSPDGSDAAGQPSIQGSSVAPEGTKNNNGNI